MRLTKSIQVALGLVFSLILANDARAVPRLVSDRIVIKPRAGVDREALRSRLAGLGFQSGGLRHGFATKAAALPDDGTLVSISTTAAQRTAMLNLLAARSDVGFAAPVYLYPVSGIPNDPQYSGQYHHAVMGSASAWDVTKGSSTVRIAILDTGVDASHPDLVGKVLPGYNAYTGTTDTSDAFGHGTAVAGCAAAAGGNGIGGCGMAWSNPILPVKIIDQTASAPSDVIAAGMRWAVDHGAKILNISFSPLQDDIVIRDAAAYVRARGGLVFIAMGNDGQRKTASEDPNIVFVNATDRSDNAATFSSYGPASKLTAPGVDILTTQKGGSYGPWNGTSFACPLVAGAAALVWAANPSLGPAQVEQCLYATVRDLGATGRDELFGYGRVDVAAAVRFATAPAQPTPVKAALTSPVPGSTLAGSTATFQWSTGTGVTRTWLYVGTAASPTAYFNQDMGTARTATVAGLPRDGSTLQVTLWSLLNGSWQSSTYAFRAASPSAAAVITSPVAGSTLPGRSVDWVFSSGTGVQQYWLYLGSSAGANNLVSLNTGTVRGARTSGLPTNGSVIYARLWSLINGQWQYVDSVYRAASTPL